MIVRLHLAFQPELKFKQAKCPLHDVGETSGVAQRPQPVSAAAGEAEARTVAGAASVSVRQNAAAIFLLLLFMEPLLSMISMFTEHLHETVVHND